MTRVTAVTACPSSIAHTYMAAEALGSAVEAKGWQVKVETQDSIGLRNELTTADVAGADIVTLTKNISVRSEERFADKTIIRVNISDVVEHVDAIMNRTGAYLA